MRKSLSVPALLTVGVVISGTIGTFLYLGGRFSGLLFLLAAILLQLGKRVFLIGRRAAVLQLKQQLRRMAYPAAGIGLAMGIGAVLMMITGYRPLASYGAMLYGGLIRNWSVSVLNAVPLIFTGLAIALAFKGGLFNIGAEGQYYVGTMAATWLGIRLGMPALAVIPLIYLLGGAAGAAYNLIPAWLKVKTGAHEVLTTMMFAYIARTLSSLFIRLNGGDPATSRHPYITFAVAESTRLPRFREFLPDANYRLHIGILLAIVAALAVQHLLFRTRLGFEIRAVGANREAARTQGVPVGRVIITTMLLSGLLAALSGVTQVLGLDHKMLSDLNAGYGWNGIAVALLAGTSPIGVIFAAFLWGILDAGGQYMARTIQTPTSIVEIIKGMILFLILAKHLFTMLRRKP